MKAAALAACGLALTLAACGTPPRERFYTLMPGDVPAPVTSPAAQPSAVEPSVVQPPALQRVALGPLTLPESLRRPQLVMRLGERLEVYEQRRWIQPLDAEIADALAERLGRRLAAPVATVRQAAAAGAVRRIALDVRRFESTPAAASLDVLWSIADGQGKHLADGRTEARQPCADGSETALIAAHGANLDRLAAELAQALTRMPVE